MQFPTMEDYRTMTKIQFPDNAILYDQDFSFYHGIPTNIVWGVGECGNHPKSLIKLVAPGYGIHGSDVYGNGAIYALPRSEKDIVLITKLMTSGETLSKPSSNVADTEEQPDAKPDDDHKTEIRFGIIERTFLGHEDHGIFTFVLHINFRTSGQGFGTYCLSYRPDGDKEHYHPLIGEAIGKICAAVGVTCWEDLMGKVVCMTRDSENGMLIAIEALPPVPHGAAYNIKEHLDQEIEY